MLNKSETIAILLNGGVSDTDLLRLPNVRRKEIKEAKNLLQRAFAGFDRYCSVIQTSVVSHKELIKVAVIFWVRSA